MADIRTCNHTKDDGTPCGAIPIQNQPYCYFHRKYYNPPALPGDKNYQAPLLESHHAIELALTHLYQAFLTKKIDMKEASFSLQILRLASKTITAIEKASKEKLREGKVLAPKMNLENVGTEPMWDRAPSPGQAEQSSAPAYSEEFLNNPIVQARIALNDRLAAEAEAEAAAPRRGTWDPYGCMPKDNNKGSN